MAKRFTETNIWNEDWFLEMPREYKLLWFFIKDQCNHGGIWRPNLRIFEAMIEAKVDLKKALEYFNGDKQRIRILASGHWYLEDFFVFQYGTTFNTENRVHQSIQSLYLKEDINLTSIRGLLDLKEGAKDKDKEIDKDSYKGGLGGIKKYTYSEILELIHKGQAKTTEEFRKIETSGSASMWVKAVDYEIYKSQTV